MSARIKIDPNVRVRGNQTFAGFEDVDGLFGVGSVVRVSEAESGLEGFGMITGIDADRRLVYLSVDWDQLKKGKGTNG